jgi:Tol biopolymer transport system component
MRERRRGIAFMAIVGLTLAVGAGYVAWAVLRDDTSSAKPESISAAAEGPHVVFQNVRGQAGGREYAHASLSSLDDQATRVTTGLVCERLYFAGKRGICLTSRVNAIGGNSYKVTITDDAFKPKRKLTAAGIPIRARVSPDGRWGATTGFVVGHSYADDKFSTKTVIIDMEKGKVVLDLEKDLTVLKDGKRAKKVDFNFWGVTFARKPGRFYATLGSGGKTYLLEADMATRTARVLKENVECPSLSPDNTRIAYKKKVNGQWRFHVLELATMKETALAEKRGIDDQVEWLDNDHILYGFSPDTWVVPADGSGAPRKYLSRALSPAVVRN